MNKQLRWKLVESRHVPDQWYIYARPVWWPFWSLQDVRTGFHEATEFMLCLMINSEPRA